MKSDSDWFHNQTSMRETDCLVGREHQSLQVQQEMFQGLLQEWGSGMAPAFLYRSDSSSASLQQEQAAVTAILPHCPNMAFKRCLHLPCASNSACVLLASQPHF